MSYNTSDLSLIVLPDGPVAFDGKHFRYSKGERLYLDNLANDFKKIYLATFVIRKGEDFYESLLHSRFQSENIEIIELQKSFFRNPGIFKKLIQFIFVFFKIFFLSRKIDAGYLFLPSYPSAMAWIALKFWRKPYFIYGADDWVQASESMFKWDIRKRDFIFKVYKRLNIFIERTIVKNALFGVAAGGQLIEKYNKNNCVTFPTSPRMTLSKNDIFERDDTCQNNTIDIINVGSFIHDKAHHILIKAFAKALNINKNLRLKLLGDGPLRQELVDLIHTLKIEEHVLFCGYIEEETELYKNLSSSDIFVLSSVTEGFPRVLYEAMCMRLPIISTNVGGIPYLLKNKENALITESNDINGIAEAINLMIKDQDLRKCIIKSASETLDDVFRRMDSSQISKLLKEYL